MRRSTLLAALILLLALALLTRCAVAPFQPSRIQPGIKLILPAVSRSEVPKATIYFPIVHKGGMVLFIP